MTRDLDNAEFDDFCGPEDADSAKGVTMMDTFYDGTTGEWLGPQLMHEGCSGEMRRFDEMQVYKRVPREGVRRGPEVKLVGVRLVNINEGARDSPKVRCRLVTQKYTNMKEAGVFVGRPPPPTSCSQAIVVGHGQRFDSRINDHHVD